MKKTVIGVAGALLAAVLTVPTVAMATTDRDQTNHIHRVAQCRLLSLRLIHQYTMNEEHRQRLTVTGKGQAFDDTEAWRAMRQFSQQSEHCAPSH